MAVLRDGHFRPTNSYRMAVNCFGDLAPPDTGPFPPRALPPWLPIIEANHSYDLEYQLATEAR
jgi:hypothetical protein